MLEIRRTAIYSDIFPKGKPKPVEEYFINVSKTYAFKIGKFLIANDDQYRINPKQFLYDWFGTKNQTHIDNIASRLTPALFITSVISSLNFYEYVLRHCGESDQLDDDQIELDLFKAYLIINTDYSRKSNRFLMNINNEDEDLQTIILFLDQFRSHEYLNYDLSYIFGTTFIKSIQLFNFLEDHPSYLRVFYKEINHNDWKEYLKRLAFQSLHMVNDRKILGFDIKKENENANLVKNIINNLVLAETVVPDEDYSYLKSSPVFYEGNDRYLVLFNKFFIEKLFIGTYFLISNRLEKKERNSFRELFTHSFSEKILLYNTLNKLFRNSKDVQYFTGDEFKKFSGKDGEPDSYVKGEENCMIFESKDIFIEKRTKQTEYPHTLIKVLRDKFLLDGTQPKGISQVANNIEKLLAGSIAKELQPKNLKKIYPIIVVHRNEFNCFGLNRLLNNWHQEKMSELHKKGLAIEKVLPLVVIDIDTLILLSEKPFDLCILIDEYISNIMTLPIVKQHKNQKLPREAFYSFHHYVFSKFNSISLFPKDTLHEYLPELFNNFTN
jgi:hypothetical protein